MWGFKETGFADRKRETARRKSEEEVGGKMGWLKGLRAAGEGYEGKKDDRRGGKQKYQKYNGDER